jgi:hypothetical protein
LPGFHQSLEGYPLRGFFVFGDRIVIHEARDCLLKPHHVGPSRRRIAKSSDL